MLRAFWTITRDRILPDMRWWWCWWNITYNISFSFKAFPRKTNDKIFRKIQRHPILRPFWSFLPKFGQKWMLLEKKAVSVFRYSNYLPSWPKSEKIIRHPPENCWTGRRTDNGNFIRPSIGRGTKKTLSFYACRAPLLSITYSM